MEEMKQGTISKRTLFWIIGPLSLLCLIGIVGGFFVFVKGGTKEKLSKIEVLTAVYPLKSFIVNLIDEADFGKRYLKVTMTLAVRREEDVNALKSYTPQLRDAFLLVLSSLSFEEVNTVEGKLEIKQLLLSRVNQILGQGIVKDIYFTEFVVQ